jgi:hypothetical protein
LIIEAVVLVPLRFFEPLIFPVFVSSSAQDQKPGLSMLTGPGWRSGPGAGGCGDGLAGGGVDGAGLGAGAAEAGGATQWFAPLDRAGAAAQPAESRTPALVISASTVTPLRLAS